MKSKHACIVRMLAFIHILVDKMDFFILVCVETDE